MELLIIDVRNTLHRAFAGSCTSHLPAIAPALARATEPQGALVNGRAEDVSRSCARIRFPGALCRPCARCGPLRF